VPLAVLGNIETFDNNSWLAAASSGHFDPQIYDYRDPLEHGLGTSLFDTMNSGDYDIDFPTAYFQPPPMHLAKGSDLVSMIDRQQQLDVDSGQFLPPATVPAATSSTALNTTQIWYGTPSSAHSVAAGALGGEDLTLAYSHPRQKLVNCDKVRSGDVDMDALCSDLAKKATCKGYGPEVDQQDFKQIVNKYVLGPGGCADSPEKSTSMAKRGAAGGGRGAAGVNLSLTG
jgi:AP-1-like factor